MPNVSSPVRSGSPLRAAAAAVILAVVASACSGGSTTAARVNGEPISDNVIRADLQAIRDNDAYLAEVAAQTAATGASGIFSPDDDAFTAAFVAQLLTTRIYLTLARQELEAAGLTPGPELLERSRERVLAGISPEAAAGFDDRFIDRLAVDDATITLLQAHLLGIDDLDTPDGERAFFDANRDRFTEVCTRHILVSTAEEADRVVGRLRRGADFADLAAEVSLDTTSAANGGEIGCTTPGVLDPAYEQAALTQPVGEPGDPVRSAFGFHVIEVLSRTEPTYEEAAPRVAQRIREAANAAVTDWITRQQATAVIEVDPRYGRWDPAAGRAVPPDAGTP